MKSKSKILPIPLAILYSILAIISGLSSFAFIAIINELITNSDEIDKSYLIKYGILLFGVIITFFVTRRLLSGGVIKLSQDIYWGIREDIINLILKAPYRKLKDYKDDIYAVLTVDVINITNASLLIITFISSIILICSCLIYMAYLSVLLFGISIGTIFLGIIVYVIRSKNTNNHFKDVRELENEFMKSFNMVLDGAKEININPSKGNDIFNLKVKGILKRANASNKIAYVKYLNSQLISHLLFYILITFLLLFSSKLFNETKEIIVSYTFVLLYLMGPIVNVMSALPIISTAIISFNKIKKIKNQLQYIHKKPKNEQGTIHDRKFYNFKNLEFRSCHFTYGKEEFSVGPIDLKIQRNSVTFIYGGNGAGKTTFINTILRLYSFNESGEIKVDGSNVSSKDMNCIKALYTPIFSDFYLFDELYGIRNIELEKVKYYLDLFDLKSKVTFNKKGFSTINLSTGQRKRLALIYAILEQRPILVLDEWAADQDPYFRNKFYTKIIPTLIKNEDLTIIAITHDDMYYKYADQLLKMEYGKLTPVNKSQLNSIFNQ